MLALQACRMLAGTPPPCRLTRPALRCRSTAAGGAPAAAALHKTPARQAACAVAPAGPPCCCAPASSSSGRRRLASVQTLWLCCCCCRQPAARLPVAPLHAAHELAAARPPRLAAGAAQRGAQHARAARRPGLPPLQRCPTPSLCHQSGRGPAGAAAPPQDLMAGSRVAAGRAARCLRPPAGWLDWAAQHYPTPAAAEADPLPVLSERPSPAPALRLLLASIRCLLCCLRCHSPVCHGCCQKPPLVPLAGPLLAPLQLEQPEAAAPHAAPPAAPLAAGAAGARCRLALPIRASAGGATLDAA